MFDVFDQPAPKALEDDEAPPADAAATPAFSLEGMYVSTVDTRAPSKPSAAVKVDIPFVAAEPLGNRTWRVTEPSLSYL